MNYTDLINGIWEFSGGLFILPTIISLVKAKEVKGLNWVTPVFFTSWGIWNVFFYPTNDLIYSFYGGIFLSIMNIIWISLLFKYKK